MGDYLKPWRRKIGVLTLVMACVLAAGWVRSLFVQDAVNVCIAKQLRLTVISVSRHLIIAMACIETDAAIPASFRESETVNWKQWSQTFANFEVTRPISDQGFSTDDDKFGDPNTDISDEWYQLPYWSLVIPLTLLSAWLLLSKPRSAKTPVQIPSAVDCGRQHGRVLQTGASEEWTFHVWGGIGYDGRVGEVAIHERV